MSKAKPSARKAINVGLLGIGTVGGGTFAVLARNQEEIARRAGCAITMKMVADKDLDRARRLVGKQGHRDGRCHRGGEPSRHRHRGRVDRRHRRRKGPDPEGDRQRQARRHRQQGAARAARQRDLRRRAEEGRDGGVRGGGGRRHPHHQVAARRAHRQPHRVDRRHHQRHQQLHPVRDARQGLELSGRAEGGAAARLRRGRPHLRHRGRGRRAQAHHHGGDRFRHPDAVQVGLHRGHLRSSRRKTSATRRNWATASSCSASPSARSRASSCGCTRR